MQSYTEQEQHDKVKAIEQTRNAMEADLHAEVRALRDEIRELKTLLVAMPSNTHLI
jgi:voltage-gated sodium channel